MSYYLGIPTKSTKFYKSKAYRIYIERSNSAGPRFLAGFGETAKCHPTELPQGKPLEENRKSRFITLCFATS